MADFDPNQYLAEKTTNTFDPDSYLTQKTGTQPESWGHWAGRKALGVLPAAGAVLGGIAATPESVGLGTIPGAAAGYVAGKGLEAAGRKYLMGDQLPADPGGPIGAVAGTVGEGLDTATQGEGLGRVLSPVGQAISNRLQKTGIGAAIRHLRPTPAVSRGLGPEGVRDVATEALDAGAIQPFQTAGKTAGNLENLADSAGALKGDLVEGSGATINPQDLASRVQQNVINPLSATTIGKQAAGDVQGRLSNLMEDIGSSPVPVGRIEAEKVAEQQGLNWLTPHQGPVKAYTSQLKGAVEDAMGNDPAFLASKRAYGNFAEGANMAGRSAGLTDSGGGLFGQMGDVGAFHAGASAALNGNPVGLALPIARAITKGRVSSTLASGAYGLGKAMQGGAGMASTGQVAAAIGARLQAPQQIQQTYLDQQTDPQTQQQLKESQ